MRCASPMLRRQSPNNLRRACLPVPLSRAHERLARPCDASPMTPETYSSPSCPALVCHAHAFDAYSETFHTIRDVLSRSRSHYTAAGPAGSCSSHALGRRRPRVGAEHYARGHSECGIIDGVHLYPVTHIVTGLQQRFAMLGDEHRLAAMTQLLAFSRRQGETINGGLARYEVVCRRAAREGHFVMSWAGCALQLLRARNMSSQQMIQFLQPFQGRLPQGEAAFHVVSAHMRRIGHILEHAPNNLGQLLHGNQQARLGNTMPTSLVGTCRLRTRRRRVGPSSGPMRQPQDQVGAVGHPTSPPEEVTAGETQWTRVSFPDSGRIMGRALIQPVQRPRQTAAPSSLT